MSTHNQIDLEAQKDPSTLEREIDGICGQGPSDHPDLAKWLMEQGIESVSLNPDSVLDTWFFLAEGQDQA